MSHPRTFCFAVLLLAICQAAVYAGDPPKPNIVHILTDDLGWQDVVCFDVDGDNPYETPNMDRLAKQGRKFMQAYSPSATCAPSRAAYISGQHPVTTGIYHVFGGKLPRPWYEGRAHITSHINPFYRYRLPVTEMTIPRELKKAGYATAHVGKWHLGGRSNGYPFPGEYGFDMSYTQDVTGGKMYYTDPDVWGPKNDVRAYGQGLAVNMRPDRLSGFATDDPNDPFQLDEDGRPFDKPLDVALKWMEKHHGEPFFLNYCTYYVHAPIQTRNRARFEYYCKKFGYDFPTDPGPINKDTPEKPNPYYATMVETLDWMIGNVVTYLEETDDPRNPGHKLIDNTYIIVSSDNGGYEKQGGETMSNNAPLRGGKQDSHEGGVRVPFIVCGPGIPKDTECQTPISLLDLYPTFVDMVGLPPSDNPKLIGCNILPLMKGETDKAKFGDGKARESIYFYFPSYHHAAGSIRKGPWKLYRNVAPGINAAPEIELFRLYNDDGSLADIGEKENLAEAMPELKSELLAELNTFLDEANVTYPYKDPKAVTPMPGQENVPAVLDRGYEKDLVWCNVETGTGKSSIVDAKLLYTVNGSLLEYTKGRREMWFDIPASIEDGKIQAKVPPGTSHAVFCLTDSAGYLITSEPLPSCKEIPFNKPGSSYVKDGYKFRPGLYALIELAEQAAAELESKGGDESLNTEIERAKAVYAASASEETSDEVFCETLRKLRGSIRALKGEVSQADNYYLNLFRPGGKF